MPDPERLLRDGGAVRVEELFRLIHRVNPTDRGLDPDEQARRYELKAGLQSLLIERFGDQLRAREDGEDLVILEHAFGERDACHALLPALTPSARSWVRWQLDAVDDAAPASAPPTLESTCPSVLDDARQALDAYDYPLAEQLLRSAFAASRGAPREALALLQLLVEHLAMDLEALALETKLDSAARRHPRVRALLAMAAARLGRLDDASRRVEGLPGLSEVHAELARQALAQGHLDLATTSLGRLRDADPAHPDGARLAEALNARRQAHRAEQRRPAEEELETLLERGHWQRLLESATTLLRRFPGSAAASAFRVRAERALVDEEVAALLAGADHDERAGRLDDAVAKLERAERLGADVQRRLGAVREAAAAALTRHAVARVRRLLPGREGLLAWATLSPQDRGAFDEPRLADLASLLDASRRPEEAVDALLALESLDQESPAKEQLAVVKPHLRLLERTRWRSLVSELRARRRRVESERRQALKVAEAAQQAEAEVARYDAAVQQGDWIAARRIARQHRDERWARRLERASTELKRAWGLRVDPGEAVPYSDLRDFRLASTLRGVNPFMTAADEILLGNRAGPLVVLRRVGTDGRVRELVELRPPGGLVENVCPEVYGDLVFFHSGPRLLVLRHTPEWDIVDDIDLVDLIGKTPRDLLVVDGRHAVLATEDKGYVVDLVDRRIEWMGAPSKEDLELRGWKGGTAVARIGEDQVTVCRRRKPDSIQARYSLRSARTPTMGPEGQLLVLGVEDQVPDGPLELFVLTPALRGTRTLGETSRRMPLRLACDRDKGLVFTIGCDVQAHWEVRAFHLKGPKPTPIWRVEVPRATELAVHRDGVAVCLVILSVVGCRVHPLDKHPPQLPAELFVRTAGPPHLGPPFTLVAEAEFRRRRRELLRLHPEQLREGADLSDADRIGVITALQAAGEDDRASRLLAEELVKAPASEPLRLLRAAEVATRREWEPALALVRELSGAGLSAGQRYWTHALECMCLARLGKLEGAHDAARRALDVEPDNDSARTVALTLAALHGVGDREEFTAFNPALAVLAHGLADARRALRERRYSAVIEHANNVYTWACWEAGGLYLICRAWQALAPTEPHEVRLARTAAGGLLEALRQEDYLPLGELTVDIDVMEDLGLELLDGLSPEEPDMELGLEDLVLAWEEGQTARQTAEEFGCSVVSVYQARRRHGLTAPPPTRESRVALLRTCGWTREDAEWQVDQSPGGWSASPP